MLILTDEEKYHSQKGKKYRNFDGMGNHWDIINREVRYHAEGYLWVAQRTMKNDSGTWLEDDGSRLDSLILDVQNGRTVEMDS